MMQNCYLLLPHLFPLLCGDGDSYETPQLNSILRFIVELDLALHPLTIIISPTSRS